MIDTSRIARGDGTKGVFVVVTAIFVFLGLALEGLMLVYWMTVLEPRLRAEAVSQADILARSQATVISHALLSSSGDARDRMVVSTLDELLLLRDPASKEAFFRSVALEIDYDAVDAEPGTLDLHRGDPVGDGFATDVAIYNPETYELLGLARFRVSERFYEQLASDLRRELLTVSLGGIAILCLVWAALIVILRKLQSQTIERLRAERELSAQEQKYARLVNSLSAYFVYGRDETGRLTYVSESVRTVLGFSPDEFAARFQDRLSAIEPPSSGAAPERVYEVELVDDEDEVHHVEISEVRTLDDQGRLSGCDGIARDVTQQRVIQQELRHAKDQAEAANKAKSQFLANMSHEIRTPLNAIVGMTALALKGEIAPKLRDQLEKIRGSARLLAEIIEDILDLSRIEAGRLEIERIEFDLDDELADLSDVVTVRAAGKDLEILFETAIDVPRKLRGDPVRLKQVLLNLLANALKFTKAGEVVVRITLAELRRDRAELRFAVSDTGIGIASEHVSTLFEPFTQVDPSMTRRFGGLGLGLAISRRLVEIMGGTLEVESASGRGSTFTFTAAFELPRVPQGPRRLAEAFRNLPVLVADDNEHARIVLGGMLRSLSCVVTEVESGEAAIDEASRAAREGAPYRVALIDWKMPGMDGAETATKLLRETRAEERPAVILVTAYDREEATRRADEAGIDVVLHKPISPSTLHDAMLRVLDARMGDVRRDSAPRERRFAPGQSVLLVEDNEINREVAREFLESAGLAVTEAFNGVEALRVLDRQTFDVVLMDVQMPELDGVETVRALRAEERFRNLPVIAMTAHAMIGDRERFLEAGMSDYVAKPIEEIELLRALGRWLESPEESAPPRTPARASSLPVSLPGIEIAEGVRRASGNEALFRRLSVDFARANAGVASRLVAMLERKEHEEALALLHSLKGSAATIGAHRLAKAAATMESAVRRNQDGGLLVAELEGAVEEYTASARTLAGERAGGAPAAARAVERTVATGPAGSADPSVVALARQLDAFLATNNLEATNCFEQLRAALPGGDDEALGELARSLDQLDFNAARAALRSIEGLLDTRAGS